MANGGLLGTVGQAAASSARRSSEVDAPVALQQRPQRVVGASTLAAVLLQRRPHGGGRGEAAHGLQKASRHCYTFTGN